MNFLTGLMLVFAVIGGIDRIFGSRLGLGKEFERGFMLLGNTALTTIGMIVLAPLLAQWLEPLSNWVYTALGLDPSIIPSVLLANDMGAASMSAEMYRHEGIGMFNGLVVSTMLGCTISYTIPYAMGCVRQEKHKELFAGLLCGIVTIPVGSFVGGLMLRLPIGLLLWDLVPLVLFSAVVACGLIFASKVTVKLFSWLGLLIRGVITVGLMLGMLEALAGIQLLPGLGKMSEATTICMNAVMVLAGAFPLMHLVSKLLAHPLDKLGGLLGIGGDGAMGLLSSLVTSTASFAMVDTMDKKCVVLNSAFAVSSAFVFGAHLAFTMAIDASYIPAMIVSKLISGICAVVLALVLYKRMYQE